MIPAYSSSLTVQKTYAARTVNAPLTGKTSKGDGGAEVVYSQAFPKGREFSFRSRHHPNVDVFQRAREGRSAASPFLSSASTASTNSPSTETLGPAAAWPRFRPRSTLHTVGMKPTECYMKKTETKEAAEGLNTQHLASKHNDALSAAFLRENGKRVALVIGSFNVLVSLCTRVFDSKIVELLHPLLRRHPLIFVNEQLQASRSAALAKAAFLLTNFRLLSTICTEIEELAALDHIAKLSSYVEAELRGDGGNEESSLLEKLLFTFCCLLIGRTTSGAFSASQDENFERDREIEGDLHLPAEVLLCYRGVQEVLMPIRHFSDARFESLQDLFASLLRIDSLVSIDVENEGFKEMYSQYVGQYQHLGIQRKVSWASSIEELAHFLLWSCLGEKIELWSEEVEVKRLGDFLNFLSQTFFLEGEKNPLGLSDLATSLLKGSRAHAHGSTFALCASFTPHYGAVSTGASDKAKRTDHTLSHPLAKAIPWPPTALSAVVDDRPSVAVKIALDLYKRQSNDRLRKDSTSARNNRWNALRLSLPNLDERRLSTIKQLNEYQRHIAEKILLLHPPLTTNKQKNAFLELKDRIVRYALLVNPFLLPSLTVKQDCSDPIMSISESTRLSESTPLSPDSLSTDYPDLIASLSFATVEYFCLVNLGELTTLKTFLPLFIRLCQMTISPGLNPDLDPFRPGALADLFTLSYAFTPQGLLDPHGEDQLLNVFRSCVFGRVDDRVPLNRVNDACGFVCLRLWRLNRRLPFALRLERLRIRRYLNSRCNTSHALGADENEKGWGTAGHDVSQVHDLFQLHALCLAIPVPLEGDGNRRGRKREALPESLLILLLQCRLVEAQLRSLCSTADIPDGKNTPDQPLLSSQLVAAAPRPPTAAKVWRQRENQLMSVILAFLKIGSRTLERVLATTRNLEDENLKAFLTTRVLLRLASLAALLRKGKSIVKILTLATGMLESQVLVFDRRLALYLVHLLTLCPPTSRSEGSSSSSRLERDQRLLLYCQIAMTVPPDPNSTSQIETAQLDDDAPPPSHIRGQEAAFFWTAAEKWVSMRTIMLRMSSQRLGMSSADTQPDAEESAQLILKERAQRLGDELENSRQQLAIFLPHCHRFRWPFAPPNYRENTNDVVEVLTTALSLNDFTENRVKFELKHVGQPWLVELAFSPLQAEASGEQILSARLESHLILQHAISFSDCRAIPANNASVLRARLLLLLSFFRRLALFGAPAGAPAGVSSDTPVSPAHVPKGRPPSPAGARRALMTGCEALRQRPEFGELYSAVVTALNLGLLGTAMDAEDAHVGKRKGRETEESERPEWERQVQLRKEGGARVGLTRYEPFNRVLLALRVVEQRALSCLQNLPKGQALFAPLSSLPAKLSFSGRPSPALEAGGGEGGGLNGETGMKRGATLSSLPSPGDDKARRQSGESSPVKGRVSRGGADREKQALKDRLARERERLALLPMQSLTSQVFGQFGRPLRKEDVVFRAKIGQGGFGKVYRVFVKQHDKSDDKSYDKSQDKSQDLQAALKLVSHTHKHTRSRGGGEVAVDRIKAIVDEMNIISQLRHRNLVKFYGIYLEDDSVGILSEYCARGNLHELLHPPLPCRIENSNGAILQPVKPQPHIHSHTQSQREGASGFSAAAVPDINQRLSLMIQICSGVEYLHSVETVGAGKALVHRDLKPMNIVLDAEWTPKLCDFGLSKILTEKLGETPGITLTRDIAGGSIRYMAPESFPYKVSHPVHPSKEANDKIGRKLSEKSAAVSGSSPPERRKIDEKVDIWSLGCIILEMLTLQVPYPRIESNWEIIDVLLNKNCSPLNSLLRSLTRSVMSECTNEGGSGTRRLPGASPTSPAEKLRVLAEYFAKATCGRRATEVLPFWFEFSVVLAACFRMNAQKRPSATTLKGALWKLNEQLLGAAARFVATAVT